MSFVLADILLEDDLHLIASNCNWAAAHMTASVWLCFLFPLHWLHSRQQSSIAATNPIVLCYSAWDKMCFVFKVILFQISSVLFYYLKCNPPTRPGPKISPTIRIRVQPASISPQINSLIFHPKYKTPTHSSLVTTWPMCILPLSLKL